MPTWREEWESDGGNSENLNYINILSEIQSLKSNKLFKLPFFSWNWIQFRKIRDRLNNIGASLISFSPPPVLHTQKIHTHFFILTFSQYSFRLNWHFCHGPVCLSAWLCSAWWILKIALQFGAPGSGYKNLKAPCSFHEYVHDHCMMACTVFRPETMQVI